MSDLMRVFFVIKDEETPIISNVSREDARKLNEILYKYDVKVFSSEQN